MDMQIDLFAEYASGKLALKKIAATDPNFRLFSGGWIGNDSKQKKMRLTGAIFRKALSGPNKGVLSIKINGTERSVYVTALEIAEFEAAEAAAAKVLAQ